MDLPSLGTFWEIIRDVFATWSSCTLKPWALAFSSVEIIFWLCLAFIIFYLYVISTMLYHRFTRNQFDTPFYNCVLILAMGDIGTLITCSRANAPICALRDIPARYLAWESFTVLCVELIYGTNLVMALIRLDAVLGCFYLKSNRQRAFLLNGILILFLMISLVWSILWFCGFAKRIWFPTDTIYKGELLFPINHIRTPWSMAELGVTFAIYSLTSFQLRKVKYLQSASYIRREYRLLFLAVLIFFCEIFFYYTSDWVGIIFGFGNEEVNTYLTYYGKPISTGITPV